ncbi:MAG: hypothetical protein HY737_09010 [Candidatus Omnitrophica bacterium]|nr:hypothetical protein [Candidatus Omnitrophota bacterium]
MKEMVKQLTANLKTVIAFVEQRASPPTGEYLEGVLTRQGLEPCRKLLEQALGPPLKDFNEAKTLEPRIQKAVDRLGGIRIEQCLFFAKGQDTQVAYAALWPWASNPEKITIKVGLCELA